MLDSVTVAGKIKDFTLENQSVKDRCGDDRVTWKSAQSSKTGTATQVSPIKNNTGLFHRIFACALLPPHSLARIRASSVISSSFIL